MNTIRTTTLTKAERNRLYIRYLLYGCPGVDAVYIQGKSWPWWLLPFFKMFYAPEEVGANVARHFTWYNTEPIAGSLIFGIILGMEEQRALHHNVDAEMITSIKSSLMGPVAGIGDSLVQATLIPILCTMTISISGESGSVMGPLFYIVALLAIILGFGYVLFVRGYSAGKASVDLFGNAGISDITKAVAVFGLIVVGCLAASRTNIGLQLAFQNNGETALVTDEINAIFPRLTGLLVIALDYYLMKIRRVQMQWIVYGTMAVVIVLSLLGIA